MQVGPAVTTDERPSSSSAYPSACDHLQDADGLEVADVPRTELDDFLPPEPPTAESESTTAGTWWADLVAGRFTWSEELHRIFGTDPNDPPRDHHEFASLVHPGDKTRVVEAVRAAARNGSSYQQEYRIIRPDGEVRNVRSRGWFRVDGEGALIDAVGAVRDTTDIAEYAQSARDLFAGVLDAATEQSIIATDLNGLITVFNTGAERMLGYSAAEMIGTSPQRLHDSSEIRTRAAELGIEPGFDVFLAMAAAGRPETRQWTYITRDGRRLQASISVNATRDRRGAINGFIKVGTDITERVEVEAALKASEARFRETFHYAPNGMMLVSYDNHGQGRILQANPALTRLTGYSHEQLLTMSVSQLTAPDDLKEYGRQLTELRAGHPIDLSVERRWIGADGQQLWVQVNISPETVPGSAYVVVQVQDITIRREFEARLTHQALHDPLTGLPNRLLLMDRLTHALAATNRSENHVAVIYLDLDDFKLINDTAGHASGDAVLIEVGTRIESVLRPGDTVARLGGDEFAILCPEIVNAEEATVIADRVLAAVRGQYTVDGFSWRLSASVGVSVSASDSTAERMLLQADQAMYSAKHAGKDMFRLRGGDPESLSHSASASRAIRVRSELSTAVEKDELILYGQPAVNMLTGEVVAVETLLRWRHPTEGLVGPREFLDVAEASDLMLPIGRRALLESSRMAATWASKLGGTSPLVHVNISGRQLESGNLRADVDDALQRYDLDPSRLVLELTETHMPMLVDSMRKDFLRMREMGIKMAIDDLGTGFSSLTRITELPVDFLKIDISFVAGMQHDAACAAVVRGILAIGQSLNLGVIAEGVETAEQADMLMEYGCDTAQGYLFSRPLSEVDLVARLTPTAPNEARSE